MDSFKNQPWGYLNQDVGQLPDDDFMAFIQKQFPGLSSTGPIPGFPTFNGAVNPHNVSVSTLTPPASEDSSPSPSNSNHDQVQESGIDDPTLKRKASSNRLGNEPSNKAQHTESSPTDKHNAPGLTQGTRRKSSGHTPKDEQRLLKRKEQNRAAQRAFRERKEKHVKDLEDMVAELEAKNEATQHDNENLRSMLSRLQSENMSLKQSSFTFSVQKNAETPSSDNNPPSHSISPTGSVISSNTISPKVSNPLDWSSLSSFDPSILNILDDNVTQPTATDSAMQMSFGFGTATGLPPDLSYTTIAENKTYMTPASIFDNLNNTPNQTSATAGVYPNSNANENSTTFNQFDLNSLSSWPGTSANLSSNSDPIFDDPYSVYLSTLTGQEFAPLRSTPSLSPVTHQTTPSSLMARSSSVASSLSPAVLGADSLFTPPADSPRTDPDSSTSGETPELTGQVPKSRTQCLKAIADGGNSMFAPPLQKSDDVAMIECIGSVTEKNPEVLAAFKALRADPQFRNGDISSLCEEFKKKACCDVTKFLEPGAVSETRENPSKNTL